MKSLVCSLVVITFFTASCEFRQSIDKDLATGATSRGDGISVEDVSMVINDNPETRNKFKLGEKVVFSFNDVQGFKLENGKTFPEVSLYVIKGDRDTLMIKERLLNLTEGSTIEPLLLTANFSSSLSFKTGDDYRIIVKLWDTKSTGTFTYELPFSLEENKFVAVESNGISAERIFLWNDSKKYAVASSKIQKNDQYILVFENIQGLAANDSIVFPALQLEVSESNGDKMMSYENLLSDVATSGAHQRNLAGQVPTTLTFNKPIVANPCTLHAVLSDLKSEHRLLVTATLEIE